MKPIRINMERLQSNIEELSSIGRREDQGIYRMAFSEADVQAREWLKKKIEDAGLEFYRDGAANLFGRLNHRNDAPSVMVGSHIDTVPGARHLDGSLGVLVALESLTRIREEGIQTERPLEMVSFTDEEGRFGGLFGSQALCGELNPESVYTAADLDGVKIADEMARYGLNAIDALKARRTAETVHSYLELHIEQGPVLDRLGLSLGLVDRITGLFKWSVRLIGHADHAGTTLMEMRRDAFGGLAEFSNEIPRVLEEYGSDTSVATIGKVELFPGSANTVPGRVEFSLDVRDTSRDVLDLLSDAFRRALSAIARRRRLMFEFEILSEVEPKNCDGAILDRLKSTCKALDVEPHVMHSGAAHDAQIMANLTRVGMIFVPSKEGCSHSPSEWTHWEDIEIGANVALNALIQIACEKGGARSE